MDRNDFLPIERDTNIRESSFIVRPNWWQRFKLNRLAVVGCRHYSRYDCVGNHWPYDFAIYLCRSILSRC